MKHFRTPLIEADPEATIFDADGLCEEDRIAIAMDEASEIRAGRLKNGICENCRTDYRTVIGVEQCWWCKEGY